MKLTKAEIDAAIDALAAMEADETDPTLFDSPAEQRAHDRAVESALEKLKAERSRRVARDEDRRVLKLTGARP